MDARLQECYDFAVGCIKNARPHNDVTDDMQIFKDYFELPEAEYIKMSKAKLRQIKRNTINQHILSLGRTGLYGKTKAYGVATGIVSDIRFMEGALSQIGRMPENEDGFYFMYLCGNNLKRWFYVYDWWEEYVKEHNEIIRWAADLDMKKPPIEYRIYNWMILSECALRRKNERLE